MLVNVDPQTGRAVDLEMIEVKGETQSEPPYDADDGKPDRGMSGN